VKTSIFSSVFAVAYLVAYQAGLAPFRYYPAQGRFSTELLPAASAGPPILWYGWLTTAALAALVIALLVPRRLADRVPPRIAWIAPLAVLIIMLIHERRWFL
jgi:hypothetical protein